MRLYKVYDNEHETYVYAETARRAKVIAFDSRMHEEWLAMKVKWIRGYEYDRSCIVWNWKHLLKIGAIDNCYGDCDVCGEYRLLVVSNGLMICDECMEA